MPQLGFTAVVALLWQEGALRVAALVLFLALSNLPGTFSLKRGGIVSFSTPFQPGTENSTHLALYVQDEIFSGLIKVWSPAQALAVVFAELGCCSCVLEM